jgi:adenosylcobinamide-GDP ribazoletransferase
VWVCRKLIGGQTGDLIGALQALIEVAVLTVLLVFV